MLSPADLSLVEASRSIAVGELLPSELLSACLGRAAEVESAVAAFTTIDGKGAAKEADSLDRELARTKPRSPLHGIPFAIKDVIDVAGMPTTAGSRVLADRNPTTDAAIVSNLRLAGGVMLGKANTHEFAYGLVCSPTRNPWDLRRIPGGSSGGSAAAVAAGICPCAVGTDTAGSIRIPAALCGVSGLQPRPGAISLRGVVPLAPSLDSVGFVARGAADLVLLWGALGQQSPTVMSPPVIARPPRIEDVADCSHGVTDAYDQALRDLVGNGARTVEVSLDRFEEWDLPRSLVQMAEVLEVHRHEGWYPDRASEYGDETLANLRYAENLSADAVAAAVKKVRELRSRFIGALENAEVIALPTTPAVAPTIDEAMIPASDGSHRSPAARKFARITGPVNVAKLAAVTVPCGFDAGMPVGIQFVARTELAALSAALFYESITDWHKSRPGLQPMA